MADQLIQPGERSTGEILRDIVSDLQEIIHSEVRLAKAELAEKGQRLGRAAGMFASAAVFGLLAGACLVTTIIAALALAMPLWLAALLTGFFLTCTSFALYLGGRARWQQVNPVPGRTVQTLKDDIAWAKHRTS
jgi:uncharacterized membrane protein YqjE